MEALTRRGFALRPDATHSVTLLAPSSRCLALCLGLPRSFLDLASLTPPLTSSLAPLDSHLPAFFRTPIPRSFNERKRTLCIPRISRESDRRCNPEKASIFIFAPLIRHLRNYLPECGTLTLRAPRLTRQALKIILSSPGKRVHGIFSRRVPSPTDEGDSDPINVGVKGCPFWWGVPVLLRPK